MRYFVALIGMCALLAGCKAQEPEEKITEDTTENPGPVDKKDLIVIEKNVYTEYYPGKKQIKFQGPQDEQGKRHGQWFFYNEKGTNISTTMYEHGLKHGHSVVKYENGAIFYVGEYQNDVQVGIWKTYKPTGELDTEKDYGYPDNND